MTHTLESIHGTAVFRYCADGEPVRDERSATDLLGEAMYSGATWLVLPADRLEDDFFRLSTRIAGGIVQKFANYRVGLAIVGDISRHTAASGALRDFVRESNRGRQLWFVADEVELRDRFAGASASR
ncbi:DUF4180 domain-containing protein [Kitasatospora sp. NPDC004240]